MALPDEVPFVAPIPGESLTAPLGGRPWQTPPQFTTVEEAMEYYIPRFEDDDVVDQLIDVLELGIPVTTVANSIQLSSVMEGKHSVDVGMLLLPILVELIMMVADSRGIEYSTGMDKEKELKSSKIARAMKIRKEKAGTEEPVEETVEQETEEAESEEPKGLMARREQ